jgi:hypothetical protein
VYENIYTFMMRRYQYNTSPQVHSFPSQIALFLRNWSGIHDHPTKNLAEVKWF